MAARCREVAVGVGDGTVAVGYGDGDNDGWRRDRTGKGRVGLAAAAVGDGGGWRQERGGRRALERRGGGGCGRAVPWTEVVASAAAGAGAEP